MSVDPAAVVAMLRRGEVAAAGAAARAALAAAPDHPLFLTVAGLAALEAGRAEEGAAHLSRAVALRPGDVANRVNLTRALVDAGRFAEAEAACRGGPPDHPALARLAAWAAWRRGDPAAAAAGYARIVALAPGAGEDWNNLGNARDAAGDLEGAIAALARAATLLPGEAAVVVNLARALGRAGRHAEARAPLRALLAQRDDGAAWLELGLAEAALGDFAAAEAAYRRAMAGAAGAAGAAAAIELGLLFEHGNRVEALDALAAEPGGGDAADFLRALAARRAGRWEEAAVLAARTPDTIDPVRRWQLVGEVEDRLGRPGAAFAAFARMNEAASASVGDGRARGAAYRAQLARAEALGDAAVAGWREAALPDAARPTPAIILGFPRSGTTLLDTCLSALPGLHVTEELPMLREVELAAGDAALPTMGAAEAAGLRARYFAALDRVAPADPARRTVDKFPLHMARAPLIHRLFPDARVILVERHPCDVVLSCYMTSFQLNPAMANFLDLEDAARLYHRVWTLWERARAALPLAVHAVRYERMVADPEAELRGAVEFLGEVWDPAVLDHRGSAARRGHIATASYAQVGQPLYRRAAGRWERYRAELAPVLPILAPWCERMGYPLA